MSCICMLRLKSPQPCVRFGGDGFVEVLSATQTPTEKVWFQGTADAVRQYKWMIQDVKNRAVEDVSVGVTAAASSLSLSPWGVHPCMHTNL
eukprot:1138687-Pelagomonas_calceolata.AAC.6